MTSLPKVPARASNAILPTELWDEVADRLNGVALAKLSQVDRHLAAVGARDGRWRDCVTRELGRAPSAPDTHRAWRTTYPALVLGRDVRDASSEIAALGTRIDASRTAVSTMFEAVQFTSALWSGLPAHMASVGLPPVLNPGPIFGGALRGLTLALGIPAAALASPFVAAKQSFVRAELERRLATAQEKLAAARIHLTTVNTGG